MNIIERTKAAIDGDQRADLLDELHVELRIHINGKGDRLKAITAKDTSTFGANPGPERQRAVDAGDLDAIKAMDKEERDLVAELEVLRSLQKRLRSHLDATKSQEFVEAAPVRYSEIAKLLATEDKAQVALLAARKTTESALSDLNAQRQHVVRTSNLEFPAADDTLLRQLMQARGYTYHRGPSRVGWFSPTSGPQQLRIVAGALGLPLPHPGRESAAA